MSASLFEAPTLGLGRLLNEGSRFTVPHHQRDYSWTEDELSQFFTDIEEARNNESEYYFIGLMVFMPGEHGEYTILDGQQRMATAAILLSAIRTWLASHALSRDADQIQSMYIAQRELGEDELNPRLVLNEANNQVFYTYVVSERPSTDIEACLAKMKRHDPSRTLLEAALFCRKEIGKLAGHAPDVATASKRLFSLVSYLREHVRVVRLVVPTEADAYTVFETLNDRGLDLTVLDLVKNYVFGKAGSKTRLADVKQQWTQMMATLTNVRGDDFLKAYWTSRHGRTQKAQLFPQIKSNHKTPDRIAEFSTDLLHTSEHYSALDSKQAYCLAVCGS